MRWLTQHKQSTGGPTGPQSLTTENIESSQGLRLSLPNQKTLIAVISVIPLHLISTNRPLLGRSLMAWLLLHSFAYFDSNFSSLESDELAKEVNDLPFVGPSGITAVWGLRSKKKKKNACVLSSEFDFIGRKRQFIEEKICTCWCWGGGPVSKIHVTWVWCPASTYERCVGSACQ